MSGGQSAEKDAGCNHAFVWRTPGDPFMPPVDSPYLAPCSRCGIAATTRDLPPGE